MKKLFAIVVLGLLLTSCTKYSWNEINHHVYERDARKNILNEKNDSDFTIYIGVYDEKTEERYKGYYEGRKVLGLTDQHVWPKEKMALRHCYKNFGHDRQKAVFKKILEVSAQQKENYRLGFDKYAKFSCEQIYKKTQKKVVEKSKKSKTKTTSRVSNNTLIRTFDCSYPSGTSKIRIRGATARETTSVGVVIKYSAVEYTKKGAFVLDGSSKGLRSWVIGTPSYLVLDGRLESTYEANCR